MGRRTLVAVLAGSSALLAAAQDTGVEPDPIGFASAGNYATDDYATDDYTYQYPEPEPEPVTPLTEALSCSQIGLDTITVASAEGMSEICVSSYDAMGNCIDEMTYEEAQMACQSIGATLCTAAELQTNVGAGSGCGMDLVRIWTQTPCAQGAITMAGSTKGLAFEEPRCSTSLEYHPARCCSRDEHVPEEVPVATCGELGWNLVGGSTRVCAESKIANVCTTNVAQSVAKDVCASVGARLCTGDELRNGEAFGSGCKLDNAWVWSSDEEHALMMNPDKQWFSEAREGAGVRCCADAGPDDVVEFEEVQSSSCEDLQAKYPGRWSYSENPQKCAESNIEGICYLSSPFDEATQICASVGARLCSAEEIQGGVTTGSGCKMDNARIWSSTLCEEGKAWTMGGSRDAQIDGLPIDIECSSESDSFLAVRCCADSARAVGQAAAQRKRKLRSAARALVEVDVAASPFGSLVELKPAGAEAFAIAPGGAFVKPSVGTFRVGGLHLNEKFTARVTPFAESGKLDRSLSVVAELVAKQL